MDAKETHIQLDIAVDKIDSEAYPELEPKEKDVFLNKSYLSIVKKLCGRNNIYRSGDEAIKKRTEDLKNLTVTGFCNPIESAVYPNIGYTVYTCDLNTIYTDDTLSVLSENKYMFYKKSMVHSVLNAGCKKWFTSKVVQQDDISMVVGDPFNSPKAEDPIIFFEDGKICIAAKDYIPDNFLVTYIKFPKPIVFGYPGEPQQDPEISEHMHQDIVEEAAKMILENIESPRQQTINTNLE